MFNRREQIALLLLTGSLLVGSGLALIDYYRASALAEFQVLPGAVEMPEISRPIASADILEKGDGEERIDLNGATAKELQRLPSIGPKTAARILEHRREHGPFQNLEALQKVPGIGPRTIEKLRSRLQVGASELTAVGEKVGQGKY